ncbi:MAG TPA: adenosylcobinamide-phosphate synthase CbiB [Acidimicrobiales bacterium]|nr:adenosylcobinamide-phosphate synthase CbiB [Acidimicrobiales bacterium]
MRRGGGDGWPDSGSGAVVRPRPGSRAQRGGGAVVRARPGSRARRYGEVSTLAARRALAAAAGLFADRLLGEPPAACHPVGAFGRLMARAERLCWADSRLVGAAYGAAGVCLATVAGVLLDGAVGLVAATWLVVAGRSLDESARRVHSALEAGDLSGARRLVGGLVGRRTAQLEESEVARAAVESVAENTVDAVVAPVLWAAGGGSAGALAYRAVNTLDAMVGHLDSRYGRFGWASARADDVANWLPARLTAVLVAAVRPSRAGQVWAAVRHQAPAHPSPNAGVAEAAFAAALGLRLGGVNDYAGRLEIRPVLGDGRQPAASDILEACRLSRDVTAAAAAGLLAAAMAMRPDRGVRRSGRRRGAGGQLLPRGRGIGPAWGFRRWSPWGGR